MKLRKLLGQILIEMGVITDQDLEKALERQEEMIEENTLPERLSRNRLVSEARCAARQYPFLGETLLEMGLIGQEQLTEALHRQEDSVGVYRSLESKKLGMVIEAGFILNSSLSLPQTLVKLLRLANRVTNAVASTLMLLDEKSGELVFSVPTGPRSEELVDIRIPPGVGIAGWVAEHKEPALIPVAREDPRFYPEIDKISGLETRSVLCIPLLSKNKLIGVLEAVNRADGTSFTEEDAMLLNIFAYQASSAIESARTYAELQESEEKYRALFDNAADSIAVIDADGRFVEVNNVFGVKSGYDREKTIGKNVFSSGILAAPSAIKAKRYFDDLLAGKQRPALEIESVRKDGGKVLYELKAVPIRKGDRIVAIQAILRNISERKQMEERLFREKEKLKDALEKVKKLSGMIPICSACKKIRDDRGYWNQLEAYIRDHSEAEFSHSICPDCVKKLYPELDSDNGGQA